MSKNAFIGMVPDLKRKAGFLKYKTCVLVVHCTELVVAHSTKVLRARFKDTSPEDHYRSLAKKHILSESPDNFVIKPEDIKRIRLIPGEGGNEDDDKGPDKLTIRTHELKHLFLFGPQSTSAEQARELLEHSFADLIA
jgi:hypothetical protein